MKKILYVWILWATGLISVAQTPAKKAVFIVVDGIPTDILHKANTPNLDRIEHEGLFLESYVGGERGGYSQTPTISSNGYATLLTGTWVNKHNVWDNGIDDPNYHYPTVFRLYKNAYPNGKTAVYSTWLDNRTKLIGEGLPATGNLKIDYAFDGLEIDTLNYPHDKHSYHIKRIDAAVALEAAKSIYKNGPDLSWVYLQFTDDESHYFGESPEFYNAIGFEDALIGLVYDAVKQREEEFGEDWLFIVTTDHGRTPLTAKSHGGQSDRERNTWLVMNKKEINDYARNNRTAAVDLLPTICDFMDISIVPSTAYELDGVSLFNPVDAFGLKSFLGENGQLSLFWTATDKKSDTTAEILVSTTNNVKIGEPDVYRKIGEVLLKDERASFPIDIPVDANFVKVVLKSPNHVLNYWVKKVNAK
ncbi:MAG: alkaline phosphatase family protein [Proteiniphilum sp.]|nr:alkaline phosphatase family protein [Porphyromonadaceae bacterium]